MSCFHACEEDGVLTERGYCNMVMALFGITGFAMLLGSGNPHIQYGGVFLGAIGIYPCIANTITWTSNNAEGVYKRGQSLTLPDLDIILTFSEVFSWALSSDGEI